MKGKVWIKYVKRVHGHPSETYFLFDKETAENKRSVEYYFEYEWPSKLPGGENSGYEHEWEVVDAPPVEMLEGMSKRAKDEVDYAIKYDYFLKKELERVKKNNAVKIKSKCGKFYIYFDKNDFEKINEFAINGWEAKFTTNSNTPYAVTRKTIKIDDKKIRKQYMMHRLVMDVLTTTNIHIDHKNGDTLDNRKENLRIATRVQNMKNRTSAKNSSSKFLGVSYCKNKRGGKKWRARIQPHDMPMIHLGYYETEKEGAYAYNISAKSIHKEFANLNDIDVTTLLNRDYIENKVNDYLKVKK